MSARYATSPKILALSVIAAIGCTTASVQADETSDGNWPAYNRTLSSDRFSPLDGFTPENVTQLERKCEYALPEPVSFQTGPLAIDGVLYFTAPYASYAIDAATCEEIWKVEHPELEGEGIVSANRGFAYLDGTLFRGTMESHVVALSAKDGSTLWDVTIPDAGPGVTIPMAPIAADGKVFIGNAGGDRANVRGHAYAYDAKTGEMLWRFEVVPDTPEILATWIMPEGHPQSGGGVWVSMSYDAETGVVYVPSGNPAPDFDRELRDGDNLYVNSIIALNGDSGELITYNQIVKRDFHDWGVSAAPALVTTASGRRIAASTNKDGLLTVLDRTDLETGLPFIYAQPTTTRVNGDVPLSRERATRFCPGMWGGSEWNGAAFHPDLNTLFVGTVDWCAEFTLLPKDTPVPATGDIWLAVKESIPEGNADWSTARGWLTAFDADSGDVKWKMEAPKPILAGVTPTASGLLFAADLAGNLFALNAETGDRLWEENLGEPLGGGIITYEAGEKQYLAAVVGNGGGVWPIDVKTSSVVVYGLP